MTIPLSASRLHLLCASVAMLALHSCIPEPACAAPAPYPIDVNSLRFGRSERTSC